MLVEILAKLFIHHLLDDSLDVAIQLAFGLAFKLRLGKFYGDDGDEAFADVIAA